MSGFLWRASNSPALFTVEPDYHSLQGDLPIQLFMLRVHCGYQLVCSDSSHCTSWVANVLIFLYPPNLLKEKSNIVGNVFDLPYYMLSDGKTDMSFISVALRVEFSLAWQREKTNCYSWNQNDHYPMYIPGSTSKHQSSVPGVKLVYFCC